MRLFQMIKPRYVRLVIVPDKNIRVAASSKELPEIRAPQSNICHQNSLSIGSNEGVPSPTCFVSHGTIPSPSTTDDLSNGAIAEKQIEPITQVFDISASSRDTSLVKCPSTAQLGPLNDVCTIDSSKTIGFFSIGNVFFIMFYDSNICDQSM